MYLQVENFLEKADYMPIIDVRSPKEFEHAHIPGSYNLPLFSDQERAEVGTLYTRQGKVIAVQKGLDFVGPKLRSFTKFALSLASRHKKEEILLYCWRGGMRSSSMAWLLGNVGLKCYLLEGGYKSYRNYVCESFKKPLKLIVIGGYTGSGKSDMLKLLEQKGEQIIDLEGIANHKGSAFGGIGMPKQPSSEMFENMLSRKIGSFNEKLPVWIEDESRNVGSVFLPQELWNTKEEAPFVFLDTDKNIRIERLLKEYASCPVDELVYSIGRLEKRLGNQRASQAKKACERGDMAEVVRICLHYYDSFYGKDIKERCLKSESCTIPIENMDCSVEIDKLMDFSKKIFK